MVYDDLNFCHFVVATFAVLVHVHLPLLILFIDVFDHFFTFYMSSMCLFLGKVLYIVVFMPKNVTLQNFSISIGE